MSEIRLKGLRSGVPIGFMAALGAFRHATTMPELGEVRLRWTPYLGQWCAALETTAPVTPQELVKLFVERVKGMTSRPEFEWADAIKDQTPATFLSAAASWIRVPELASWFTSFATELKFGDDGKLESTPFDMTVARQKFLADALWLHQSLGEPDKKKGDQRSVASFREALFEQWRYEDDQHSLGWDPGTVSMGAYTGKAPTAMKKAGVRAAVWLAMESLPLMPSVYEGGLATVGFYVKARKQFLVWPVWEEPLTLRTVKTLLCQVVNLPSKDVSLRGLSGIYESRIYKPNKYLSSFQAPAWKA